VGRRLLLAIPVALILAMGAGVAVATDTPELSATGPTGVTGTEATAVFDLGDRTIRQVRYDDRETLVYTFELTNEGSLPVRVVGLADPDVEARLFEQLELVDEDGSEEFTIGGRESQQVSLHLRMTNCESLSARSGSFVSQVVLETASLIGVVGGAEVTVELPEEVRTGSPREAGCANATATSRSSG
jgi:hypothetical protein